MSVKRPMKVVKDFPPMIDAIDAKFHVRDFPTQLLFAWGDTIYNPTGETIQLELIAHEMAHGEQQLKMGVPEWWERYIADDKFRLAEEVLGHAAEYAFLAKDRPRNIRRQILTITARRLCNPLYRYHCAPDHARYLLKRATVEAANVGVL